MASFLGSEPLRWPEGRSLSCHFLSHREGGRERIVLNESLQNLMKNDFLMGSQLRLGIGFQFRTSGEVSKDLFK
jgi:hypothetical protein